jgi:4-methylaminobutanoate oxidase (formaldehyde-forming)
MDLSSVDIRRSFPFQSDKKYLEARISESLGLLYAMHWPFRQYGSARGVRKSPLHETCEAAGAVFGETAGWERPNWYVSGNQPRNYVYSYGKQNWHNNMLLECQAAREAVALFDQSSFAKFSVSGDDALATLNRISCNNVDVKTGRGVYTQWLNERGGIESDLTVSRLGDQNFLVITSAASETRDWAWLKQAAKNSSVTISNITDQFAVLGVMGPKARDLLQPLTATDLSNSAFPFGMIKEISINGFACRALRMSYVGELGWELYVPAGEAKSLAKALERSGASYGLRYAGFHAMNSLRLEAGYRHWGHDITGEDTPLEAGLGFTISWDKPGGFIGREALLPSKGKVPTKRLIQIRVEDPDLLTYHDDPIFKNGNLVGRTTGGMWSMTENRCLTMSYVNNENGVSKAWVDEGEWEIEIGMRRRKVTASVESFYDPRHERVRN